MALMLTDVRLDTSVVKQVDGCVVDGCQPLGQNVFVSSTFAERLQWVLDHRKDVVGNASSWAKSAGLSRSHIRITIRRGSSMSAEAVAKLAETAGVSLRWLATGAGSPTDVDEPRAEDPYGPRRIAIGAARADGFVSERAIVQAQALTGEAFRFWTAAQWGELLLKLTIADARNDQDQFHLLMAKAREKAEAEARAAAEKERETVPPEPAPKKHRIAR